MSVFQTNINKIYDKFKIRKNNKSFDSICFPKKYDLQLPQIFLSEFMSPKTKNMSVLIYHRIGSGKTCTAIRIGEKWKKIKRIVVVLPASLKNNFRTELRTLCAENNYLKPNERKELALLKPDDSKYKEIIAQSNKRIDKYYEIYSYNKFIDRLKDQTLNLKNSLLIIDEIQNMVSEGGTFYDTLYKALNNAPNDLRLVLLSATPMFDKPNEPALTMNLMRLREKFPTHTDFDKKFIKKIIKQDGSITYKPINMDKFKRLLDGYISYFRGAPAYTFPTMKKKIVYCEMSEFQYNTYLKVAKNSDNIESSSNKKEDDLNITDLPNNFHLGKRIISNIAFPNKKINEAGFKSLTNEKILKNLQMYSVKFYEIMNKISNKSGKMFVYSSFKEYGGIKSFVKVLNAYGYKNYIKDGPGPLRYAIWSGDEDISTKEKIKTVYNMKNNLKGTQIKILIGSIAIKEGVSLSAVRQVHVLEPYWNQSRLEQIIGRASRYCSHKDLDESQRNVKVYIYISTAPNFYTQIVPETVDQYIYKLSIEKSKLINVFESNIKSIAIDCALNTNANTYDGENKIVCGF